jgi:hypothetical protein
MAEAQIPEQPIIFPPVHCATYGDSGAGKSTFAATWPKPMIVFCFDPFGKETPYLKRGDPSELMVDQFGTPIRHVKSRKTGEMIIQIEYYHNEFSTPHLALRSGKESGKERGRIMYDVTDQTLVDAYWRFLHRMSIFQKEYDQWATVVADSTTFMEIAARKYDQYIMNPMTGDPRQWWASSTDALEEMLMIRFGGFPMNVVVLCHIDEAKDEAHGFFVRNPALPGRMRKSFAAAYGEFYRAYVDKGEANERLHLLQTRMDNMWNCSTQVSAPDRCPQHYQALWGEWEG